MMPLEPLQGGKCLGNLLQITLADGNHVEDVAVLRNLDGQGLGRAQRGAELIALEESSNTQDFRFDGGCDWCCRGCLHCFQKKRRASSPPLILSRPARPGSRASVSSRPHNLYPTFTPIT